jgi:hypothetical protein
VEAYGRYQLIQKLATGGMAEIFLARQAGVGGLARPLVVKRIKELLANDEEFVRMFLDEARIAARLNHPNIVQISDLGAAGGTFYIAMEFIHGDDLRRIWRRCQLSGRELPVELVLRIIADACAGLDYAHRRVDPSGKPLSIVHRDISPQNILVSFDGAVKLVDFGIAKAADMGTVTQTGVLKGKYSYMSPEQAEGHRVDLRSDVFSLGVVLYELLTGQRLFRRLTELQTLRAVTECRIEAPSSVSDRVPAALDAVVQKALARRAEERYGSAAELQSALEAWMTNHQVHASSGEVAAFMRELYAERLTKEASTGEIVVEDPDGELGEGAAPGGAATGSFESTTAMRPGGRRGTFSRGRPGGAEAPELSLSATGPNSWGWVPRAREPLGWLAMVGAALLLMAVGAGVGWGVRRASSPAGEGGVTRVSLSSEPQGALVFLGEVELPCRTPCEVPITVPGTYSLLLKMEGHRDHRSQVVVPAGGALRLPPVRLEPLPGAQGRRPRRELRPGASARSRRRAA